VLVEGGTEREKKETERGGRVERGDGNCRDLALRIGQRRRQGYQMSSLSLKSDALLFRKLNKNTDYY